MPNQRQWWHRLLARKCWNCDVPLECVSSAYGRKCPICLTFYSETMMFAHEHRVRDGWHSETAIALPVRPEGAV